MPHVVLLLAHPSLLSALPVLWKPQAFHFCRSSNAAAGETPARAISQHVIGAARRSEACAASPARESRSRISSLVGGSIPNSEAKPVSHSFAVIVCSRYPRTDCGSAPQIRQPSWSAPARHWLPPRRLELYQVASDAPQHSYDTASLRLGHSRRLL